MPLINQTTYKGTILDMGLLGQRWSCINAKTYPLPKSKMVWLLVKALRRRVFILFQMGCIDFNKKSFTCVNVPFSDVGKNENIMT